MIKFLRGMLALLMLPFQLVHDIMLWLRPARTQVQEPAPSDARAASEVRAAATDQADRNAKTLGAALDVRSAARAILRGDDTVTADPSVAAWLRAMTTPALMSVCAMSPENVVQLLAGATLHGVPGHDADAQERAAIVQRLREDIAAGRPVGQPPEPPEPRPLTDEERRDAFHAALESYLMEHAVGASRGPGFPR